jgi:hypothetical protein
MMAGVSGMKTLALGVALACAVAGVRPARAAAPAVPDTAVTTRDGAVYQGVLVEQIPGSHVTIQTADGKIHTFAPSEVAVVRALGSSGVVRPLPHAGADVLVELTSTNEGARLIQMSVAGGGAGAPNPEVCGPPCGKKVAAGSYIIAGNGLVQSSPFELRESAAHVRITADPVTHDRRTTGIILAAGGGITAGTVTLPIWLFGAALESEESREAQAMTGGSSTHIGSTVKWTGIVLTAACLVAGVAGLVILSGDTTVRVDPVSP